MIVWRWNPAVGKRCLLLTVLLGLLIGLVALILLPNSEQTIQEHSGHIYNLIDKHIKEVNWMKYFGYAFPIRLRDHKTEPRRKDLKADSKVKPHSGPVSRVLDRSVSEDKAVSWNYFKIFMEDTTSKNKVLKEPEVTPEPNYTRRMVNNTENILVSDTINRINTSHVSSSQSSKQLAQDSHEVCTPEKMKRIGWYQLTTWFLDYPGQEMFLDCEFSCCSLNTSATLKGRLGSADALIFDDYLVHDKQPPVRPTPEQIWIFFSMEPPAYMSRYFLNLPSWEGMFNWTMTFRNDSDLVVPYITVENDLDPVQKDYKAILAMKTQKALWVVSHCNTVSKRDEYIQILNKTFQIDIFGKCGTMTCSLDCSETYEAYKFIIAFENSFCKDYISEKSCNGLIHDIVPIVRGAGNYNRLLPPGVVIDAGDFDSVEALSDYLNYLDFNDTAYLEYLQRKEGYKFQCVSMQTRKAMYCDLCKKLHNVDVYGKTIPDLMSWVDQCTTNIKIVAKRARQNIENPNLNSKT